MKQTIDQYRISTGTVYEYDEQANAYVCIGQTSQFTRGQLRAMQKETIEIGEDE